MGLQVSDPNGGNTASNHPGASRHPSLAKAGKKPQLIQEAYPASVVAKSGAAVA